MSEGGNLRPRCSALAASFSFFTSLLLTTAAAAQTSRFGDSTWVAPYPVADSLEVPATLGPRVAEPDHEPVGETILRAPFRLLFLPVRLVARGSEGLIEAAQLDLAGVDPFNIQIGNAFLRPTVNYSSTAGFSVPLFLRVPGQHDARTRFSAGVLWSTNDHRRAEGRLRFGNDEAPWSVFLDGSYAYQPNLPFYGVGNFSREADRSIYLSEAGNATLGVRIGPTLRLQLRGALGLSIAGSRRGYNDSPSSFDRFDASEVPFLGESSDLWYGTVGADWAAIDDAREPSRGIHLTAEGKRTAPLDDSGVRYWEVHTTGRAYVPVFARHRVIALLASHWYVDPVGTVDVPFYRLPNSDEFYRFAAYASSRFVDRHLAIARAEYRWWLLPGVMAIGFAELGEVAPNASDLRIADVHESYGGGFRFATNPFTTVRAEIANGAEGLEFQIRFGGTF